MTPTPGRVPGLYLFGMMMIELIVRLTLGWARGMIWLMRWALRTPPSSRHLRLPQPLRQILSPQVRVTFEHL